MNYRTGNNPHEPIAEDHRSRVWQFIIRSGYTHYDIEGFSQHANLVGWISRRVDGMYLIRGICQFSNPRSYYIMKTRYSKTAEWIPLKATDLFKISEYTTRAYPTDGIRTVLSNPNPTPLEKVGYGIVVPDILEDYATARVVASLDRPAAPPSEGYDGDDSDDEEFTVAAPILYPPRVPLNHQEWALGPNGRYYYMFTWVDDEIVIDPQFVGQSSSSRP